MMGAHETPDAVLTRLEADRLRARALELVAELDGLRDPFRITVDPMAWRKEIIGWAGSASIILKELARG